MTQQGFGSLARTQSPQESTLRTPAPGNDVPQREEFQTLILDHAQNPLNFGKPVAHHRMGFRENPVCGDRYRVFLQLASDQQSASNRIETIRFTGTGCTISMASASIMTGIVNGIQVTDTESLIEQVERFLTNHSGKFDDAWGDLIALSGIRNLPLRAKCATLPWQALRSAILDESASPTK